MKIVEEVSKRGRTSFPLPDPYVSPGEDTILLSLKWQLPCSFWSRLDVATFGASPTVIN